MLKTFAAANLMDYSAFWQLYAPLALSHKLSTMISFVKEEKKMT